MGLIGINNFLFVLILVTSSTLLLPEGAEAVEAGIDPVAEEMEPGSASLTPLSQKYVNNVLASTKTDERIKTICGKYPHPDVCEKTILEMNKGHDPKMLVPKSLVDLQVTSMLEIIELASMDCVALGKADGQCADAYRQAVDELVAAMNASIEGMAGPPPKVMEAVAPCIEGSLKHVDTCQTKLLGENTSPLIGVNDFLKKLGENTFALANDVRNNAIV